MNRLAAAIFMLALLFVGGCIGWWLSGQAHIDACLDAGGRWEYPGGYCVGAKFASPE